MSRKKIIIIGSFVLCIVLGKALWDQFCQRSYTAKELGIDEIVSSNDEDQDGIDDYSDFVISARNYVNTKPIYQSNYYTGGYPNDGHGVCTDVIWNAYLGAGYNLKELVDQDIKENSDEYGVENPDPNIDFRRVVNLDVFLKRNAITLTNDLTETAEWQPGDIVVFRKHIAICSDKRNKKGVPFIIHHDTKGAKEENAMWKFKIVGHYRWK